MKTLAAICDGLEASTADFISKDDYLSHKFADLERRELWPKVWQIVGREEELPRIGDYLTYDVGSESIIVVRASEGEIKGFFNVCLHRGRRLMEGCGHTQKFFCRYHGWRWNIDGTNDVVVDREEWGGRLTDENLKLGRVQVEVWGGWIFINMDPHAPPLLEWLDPLPRVFRNYEHDRFRFSWYRGTVLQCNWKVALEAFIEGYHASTTHRQALPFSGDEHWACDLFGRHSVFRYRADNPMVGTPSPRLGAETPRDLRSSILGYLEQLHGDLDCLVTPQAVEAGRRMKAALPADAGYVDVMMKLTEMHREVALEAGAGWPEISLEEVFMAGTAWHIFPNISLLPTLDGLLVYRALPHADSPDQCRLEIWALQRYAPGAEPALQREFYSDWRDTKWPRIFEQDFQNLKAVQDGMKSQGFRGAQPNPLSEATVANFHQQLRSQLAAKRR